LTTAAVVLAAGSGTRFTGSEPKLLTPYRGRRLVTWAVDAARTAGLDETIVVAGAVDMRPVLPPDVTVVVNDDWAEGQAGSLRVGWMTAEQHGHDAVVVGLGDQPLIGADVWRAVADASVTPIAVATFDGERRPPVRLAAEIWPLLPTSGDEGARILMRSRPELVSEIRCTGQPVDIDTVEDLIRWS